VRPVTSEAADVLESVRSATAEVSRRAQRVHLVPERLGPYGAELAAEGVLSAAASSAEWHVDSSAPVEIRAGRVLALATINFGSGWHPVVRKPPGLSGARTMAAALNRWMDATPVDARRLATVDADLAHQIFDQPRISEADELMALFAAALNDLGRLVLAQYDGSFAALVEGADHSAARLVGILGDLPSFRDVATYQGFEVPLYKRGQLAAADLHRAFGGEGLGRLDDLDRLTAFADNLVPHVLRLDGVLLYDSDLARRIQAGELLEAGSPEEVEIRAVGVHAVEELRASLAGDGHDVPSWHLDEVLWRRGGAARYKAEPRHRARSTFY
jgi:hypothetical protein